jgi:hypothetical protein
METPEGDRGAELCLIHVMSSFLHRRLHETVPPGVSFLHIEFGYKPRLDCLREFDAAAMKFYILARHNGEIH